MDNLVKDTMDKDDLIRLQGRLFDMAKHICGVLERHNITYFLCFGTLLGAVRHGGYIPWDDDFDIILLDNQYDEAMKVLENNMMENTIIESSETEPNFFHAWNRIKDTKTVVYSTLSLKDNTYKERGISFDLFRLAPLKESEVMSYKCNNWNKYKKRIFELGHISQEELNNEISKNLKIIEQDNLVDYGSDETVYSTIVGNLKPLKESSIMPPKRIKFNGHEFYTFNDADAHLVNVYGDYMRLPDEKDRVSHYKEVEFLD